MLYKKIHIGSLIKKVVEEQNIDLHRICNFFNLEEKDIREMYKKNDISTDMLLKWSKIAEYDFFRIYSYHLILYAPSKSTDFSKVKKVSSLPTFRKNLYSQEIIDFILELLHTGKKTKKDIIDDYRIPKTTLYKWIAKHSAKGD
ncbi:transposase [Chryseobacterium sp. CKR4-1]|uniref:transposase n=1 Tax=Chryseobacterium sp. CKR4-1 TaxID=3068896 RepID=UPI0027964977|nr:transposase [Chryseobacterium sp. CKR4-1]MDQ1805093.1 transposase [Chryseobacterium sp. CKR4-1]